MNEQKLRQLKNKVEAAVHLFLANDADLLNLAKGVHEQTVSHRIAIFLEPLFSDYSIDCEYNKHLDKCKRFNINDLRRGEFKECGCETCKKIVNSQICEIKERLFRPDIIIHNRGTDERNQIAIEVKKHYLCSFDQAKLKALTYHKRDGGEYGYELGVFIYFPNGEAEYRWFVGGKEIDFYKYLI